MKILVQLAHPAHFHYYKNSIKQLQKDGHNVVLVLTTKDILETLVKDAGFEYTNIMVKSHKNSKIGYLYDMIVRCIRILLLSLKHKIDLLTGSTIEISLIGWFLRKPSINIGEDDAAVVQKYINMVAPFIDVRLTPVVCNDGKLEPHSVHYPSNMELGYLNPNHFNADNMRDAAA